jgi:hypothetical protein
MMINMNRAISRKYYTFEVVEHWILSSTTNWRGVMQLGLFFILSSRSRTDSR